MTLKELFWPWGALREARTQLANVTREAVDWHIRFDSEQALTEALQAKLYRLTDRDARGRFVKREG